jgi:hypothetical protein
MSMHSRLEHLEQIARLVAAERHAESAISDHDEAESELSRAAERIETTAKELQEAKLRHLHETKLRGFANGQAKWEEEVARVEPIYRAMCASPEWERLCGIAEDLGRGPFRLKMAVAQRGRETICLPFETNGERGDAWLPDDRMIDLEVGWSVTEPFTLVRPVRAGHFGRERGTWTIASVASFADLARSISVVPPEFKAYGGGNPATVLPVMARYFVDLVAREELIPFLIEKLGRELMRIEAEMLEEL